MDAMRDPGGQVVVTFTYDEAFVLSEALDRWQRTGTMDQWPFEDQAEQRVLWDLTASFEPIIDELFNENYADILARARAAVRDPAEG